MMISDSPICGVGPFPSSTGQKEFFNNQWKGNIDHSQERECALHMQYILVLPGSFCIEFKTILIFPLLSWIRKTLPLVRVISLKAIFPFYGSIFSYDQHIRSLFEFWCEVICKRFLFS